MDKTKFNRRKTKSHVELCGTETDTSHTTTPSPIRNKTEIFKKVKTPHKQWTQMKGFPSSIPNNMILMRILSSIAYLISILISAFRIQFFHCKNAHHFSLFFSRSLFFAYFPLRLRNNLTRNLKKKGIDPGDFLGFPFRGFEGKGIPSTHSHLPTV